MRATAIALLVLMAGGVDLAAQQPGIITGRVLAEGENTPIAGARVLVADGSEETTTDKDGQFTIPRVSPGPHTVTVMRDGYATLSEPVSVSAAQTVILEEVRLPLAPRLSQELTVIGRLSDYIETSATAAKTSARLIDVPQAIAVLPARLLDDIGALDTKDLYRHVSGVVDSPYSSTVVRGFTQREVLVNGVRGNPFGSLDGDVAASGFSTSQFRLTNVERVEILKGPSSVLYGSGEPGGVINYVTKKPREEFEGSARVGTGQYGQTLGDADVTGPINAARSALYRGAVYFEDRDSFRFNAAIRNVHSVGEVTWKPAPRAALSFEYEYIDQLNSGHRLRGVPVDAAGDFLADYRWTATEPSDFTDLRAHVAQVHWDQLLPRSARLDSTFRFVSYDRRENYHEPRGITGGGLLMQREFRDQLRTNDDWSWSINLSAPARLGRVGRHDLAAGADVTRQDHLFRFGTARQQNAGGPVPPIALSNPVYGLVDPAAYGLASYSPDTAVSTRSGVYAQDMITLGARWHVLLGGRLDRYDDTGQSAGVPLAAEQTVLTGRAGVVFKPRSHISLYASVANGFNRAAILSQSPGANGPHDPETARQVEAGAKSEWLAGRLQLTGAFFHAEKENVLRPDPALGPSGNNVNAVLATGAVRNRGVEVDLAGALTRRWNLAFNYAYLDSTITDDVNRALVGHAMPNAAPHAVGLFTRVDLPAGAGAAASLQYVADREEPFAGIRAPSYTVVDVHYMQQLASRLRLAFKIENLFDRQYAASSLFAARAGNVPGQPRTASVTMTVSTRRRTPRHPNPAAGLGTPPRHPNPAAGLGTPP